MSCAATPGSFDHARSHYTEPHDAATDERATCTHVDLRAIAS
jgi:hypothetical protein